MVARKKEKKREKKKKEKTAPNYPCGSTFLLPLVTFIISFNG